MGTSALSKFDVTKAAGTWHQFAGTRHWVAHRVEIDDESSNVVKHYANRTVAGQFHTTQDFLRYKVKWRRGWPFATNHVIKAVGPVRKGQYEWLVIGNRSGRQFVVLCRGEGLTPHQQVRKAIGVDWERLIFNAQR